MTNPDVGTVMTPVNEESNNGQQSISNHNLIRRGESHPPERIAVRVTYQVPSQPSNEAIDSDTEMEDTVVLRAPVSTPQNSTRNTAGRESLSHLADPSEDVAPRRPQRIRKPVDTFKPASWNVRAM